MTQVLREAAEVRDALEQARSTEDARLGRQESEACLTLIAARLLSAGNQPDPSPGPPRPRGPTAPGAR